MANYAEVKAAVIDLVDDFTKKDVANNYKPKGLSLYTAQTGLADLGINEPVLAVMYVRFNKVLSSPHLCGSKWKPVGSLDLVEMESIGDLIKLACRQGGVAVSLGEPT